MEKLRNLTQSELGDLLDNAEGVESLALESDEVQSVQLEREMALASNRSLAEQNLDLKPQLEQGRERLLERYSELTTVRERYRQHCRQRDGFAEQVSAEGLLSRLQTEGANTEVESEALADSFLGGSLPLDSFLERFLSLRSLAHQRRVRMDKLQEILRQKKDAIGDGAVRAPGSVTSPPCVNQEGGFAGPPWQPQPQPRQLQPNNAGLPAMSQSDTNPALPYTPYPLSPPNPPAQFTPYPSTGLPYHPGFGPPPCPYPAQPAFPGLPRLQVGQHGPPNTAYPCPYPSSYSYPGFCHPTAPSFPPSQPPVTRPAFGVPQPYS